MIDHRAAASPNPWVDPSILDTEQGTITPPSAWIYRAARDWRSLLVMVPLMALMIGV